jgi:hypothetical protein
MQLVPPGMPYTLVTLCKTAAAFAAGSPVFYPPKSKARTALCSGHARRMDISLFFFILF